MASLVLEPQRPVESPAPRAVCLIVSAIALGIAIHIRDGLVHPGAIAWLTLSIAFACAGCRQWPSPSLLGQHASRLLPMVVLCGIGLQLLLLICSRVPDGWHRAESALPYYVLLLTAALLVAAMAIYPHRTHAFFPAILLVFALLGLWVLGSAASPRIDVWTSQMAGLDAMRHHVDPWSSSFPDVYHLPDLYAPGTVKDGIVYLGFPYPPLTVLFDLPGYAIFHDFRYSNLAAMILTAGFIAFARPGRIGPLAAILFLFTPRAFLVLRNGWTEPQVAMLLAATVFCACRFPRAMPWMLGLFLVGKQYIPLAAVPAMLLIQPKWNLRRAVLLLTKAAVAGAVVSIPLALWNTPAFLHSNFLVAGGAKFRLDALSYFAFYANVMDWQPPMRLGSVSFLAAIVTAALLLRRAERSPAGFAAAVGLMFLVFFSLNKFAFCNYYYFIIASLCTSAAAMPLAQGASTNVTADESPAFPLAA